MIFAGSASAGSSTVFTNQGGGTIAEAVTYFLDDASAGNASFVNQAATDSGRPQPGGTVFFDNATAANGTFVNQGSGGGNGPGNIAFYDNSTAANGFFACDGAVSDDGTGGGVNFLDTASGGDATFILSGSDFDGAEGAFISFLGTSTAGNATLIANGGPVADSGASIQFLDDSKGDTARVEVFDNGNLNISGHNAPGVTVGSIEGSGNVFLGANNLTMGSNNLSTTFSGVIQGGGSFRKIGRGRLVLTGDNHYGGKTIIKKGHLVINNSQGSGTGNGPVVVENGTLGGRGTIGGSVTVGNGNNGSAALAPGKNADTPQTLTIRRSLGFNGNGRYNCDLNSNDKAADAVVAHGVTIDRAVFSLRDLGHSTLTPGLVFVVINNIATTPINGSFINMPDGSGISSGFNTFEADYEGGDGNDLTLTVVP
jgi:autotransporter-associated beta strand protein